MNLILWSASPTIANSIRATGKYYYMCTHNTNEKNLLGVVNLGVDMSNSDSYKGIRLKQNRLVAKMKRKFWLGYF